MDRTYEFKRLSLYWQSLANVTVDYEEDGHVLLDKFSSLSSIVYAQLSALDFIISPYSLVHDVSTTKTSTIRGKLMLPRVMNVSKYIQLKRKAFNMIGIESIVHDTKIINELIGQLESTLKSEYKSVSKGSTIKEYKSGIIDCLKHLFQTVSNNIQEYERFKLKLESQLNTNLRLISDNISEYRDINKEANNAFKLPNNYLRHFHTQYNTSIKGCISPPVKSNKDPQQERLIAPLPGIKDLNKQLTINKNGFQPPPDVIMESGVLEQQYDKLVNNINDKMQNIELNTIKGVQERLTEISSMFEKFTGTLAEQLDIFESINANVIESLSNIEKTEDTLKKTSNEGMPLYHLILCYSLIGLSIFLLLADLLKNTNKYYLY